MFCLCRSSYVACPFTDRSLCVCFSVCSLSFHNLFASRILQVALFINQYSQAAGDPQGNYHVMPDDWMELEEDILSAS